MCTVAGKSRFSFTQAESFESETGVGHSGDWGWNVSSKRLIKISRAKIWPPRTSSVSVNTVDSPLSDWLLLQTSRRVLTEGEPLALRCHGWMNKRVYNMFFYRDGKSFKFSQNSEVTIPKTNLSHSGIYHCSGMGKVNYTSAGVSITVKGIPSRWRELQL